MMVQWFMGWMRKKGQFVLVRWIRVSSAHHCTSSVAIVSSEGHARSRARARLSDRMNNNLPSITNVCSIPPIICLMPTRIGARSISRAERLISKVDSWTVKAICCRASRALDGEPGGLELGHVNLWLRFRW